MQTLEELKEEYINKFTEIVDVEGCQAFSDICNKKDDNGQFICEYCRRWGGQQREELRFSGNIDDVWQFIEEAIREEREETKTMEEWEEDFWDIMRNDFGIVDFSGTQARAYELKQFISELIEKEKESAFDLGYITGRQVAIESIVN